MSISAINQSDARDEDRSDISCVTVTTMLASVGRLFRRGKEATWSALVALQRLARRLLARSLWQPANRRIIAAPTRTCHSFTLRACQRQNRRASSIHRRDFLIDAPAIRNARNSPENNIIIFSNRLKTACLRAHFALLASLLSNRFSPLAIFLIASGSNIKNRPNSLTTNEKTFSNR